MTTKNLTSWIGIVILSMASFSFTLSASAADSADKAVLAANTQFYAALNKMFTGDVKPMEALWSHADDVTYMGPGGEFQVGWAQIQKEWASQAAIKMGGKVEATGIRVVVGTDISVVSTVEKGENTNANGQVQKVSIRATNIFRKEAGHWKMIGHHTDLLPWLVQAAH